MSVTKLITKVITVGLGAILVAGCSVLSPQPDRSRFYILTPVSSGGAMIAVPASTSADSQLTIGVGPVDFPDYLRRIEIDEREVRIRARFDGASPVDTESACSIGGSERGNAANIQASVDQSGQCPLNARDPAPDLEEALAPFHFRRTRGMIGTNHIHFPAYDGCPECISF